MSNKEGPIKPDYSDLDRDKYGEMISTPSRRGDFVGRYILDGLLEEELQAEPHGRTVNVFNVACGHAHEFEHFGKLPEGKAERVRLTGLDISGDNLGAARTYYKTEHPELNKRIQFIRGDVTEPIAELEEGTFDVAMGINAMAYVPAHMLDAIYRALKPGGKAVVNFMVTDKNPEYVEYYRSKGMITDDQWYEVQKENLSSFAAPIMQHDHSGNESSEMAKLGRQSFFYTVEQVKALLEFLGFEICEHTEYKFPSMASRKNVHDVFTIRKPLSAAEEGERRKFLRQVFQQIMQRTGGSVDQVSANVRDRIREKVGDHKDDLIETNFPGVAETISRQN